METSSWFQKYKELKIVVRSSEVFRTKARPFHGADCSLQPSPHAFLNVDCKMQIRSSDGSCF